MKIPCARCGKKIESTSTYCKNCERELKGETPSSSKKGLFLLILLLCAVGVGAHFALKDDTFMQTAMNTVTEVTESVSSPTTVPEKNTESQDLKQTTSETTESPTTSEDGPETAENSKLPASEEQKETEQAVEQPVEEVNELVVEEPQESDETTVVVTIDEEQPTKKTTTTETATEDATQEVVKPEPTETTEAEKPKEFKDSVFVYYLRNKDNDKKFQKILLDAGYVNAVSKGKYPGTFRDQNIFYRFEEQPGLNQLTKSLGDSAFETYFFNNERISPKVKRIFNKNKNVQFVIIVK